MLNSDWEVRITAVTSVAGGTDVRSSLDIASKADDKANEGFVDNISEDVLEARLSVIDDKECMLSVIVDSKFIRAVSAKVDISGIFVILGNAAEEGVSVYDTRLDVVGGVSKLTALRVEMDPT